MLDPNKDGIDHINVYSKGKTQLGRLLSNFANTPFKHPVYGEFESVEGFWYWLKTGKQWDCLRFLSGWDAKEIGSDLKAVYIDNFDDIVKTAIFCKITQNKEIQKLLIANSLPLEHYYYREANGKFRIHNCPQHRWQLDTILHIRVH